MAERESDAVDNVTPTVVGSSSESQRTTKAQYVLGHSPAEIRRLIMQAKVLRPITERLLQSAGVGTGMRVLDLGCGAGDVSILAAELVGPSGSVVGIDRSSDVIAEARERTRTAKLEHVIFRDVELAAFSDSDGFDCVIGRYVLIHQADPTSFLQAAARLARPGGIVALHEVDLTAGLRSLPIVWRWNAVAELALAAFREALPHHDAANRLIEHFSNAGLPAPNLFCEVPVGGGENSPLYTWLAETLRSMQPQLVRMGVLADEALSIETFESRLRTAVLDAHSQILGPAQVCAWTRIIS
jgi:ubiquinone/menaquinone biosynthesis C-methylase UbiE